MTSIDRLAEIMERLRGPQGCPWDREQTVASLRKYVIEETYEVVEAIDEKDWGKLREELGDLLLQVVFLSQLAKEAGQFNLDDVAAGISEKLVRRHPHVFGSAEANNVAEVWRRWEKIKEGERRAASNGAATPSRLDGVPRHLPALAKARLFADKAARAGFDWSSPEAIVDKVEEETAELRQAMASNSAAGPAEELGDLFFAAASLARRLGLDPEACAEQANRKFERRFREVERLVAERGAKLEDFDERGLDALWRRAKELVPAR